MKLFTTILGGVCAILSAPRTPDLCAYANRRQRSSGATLALPTSYNSKGVCTVPRQVSSSDRVAVGSLPNVRPMGIEPKE